MDSSKCSYREKTSFSRTLWNSGKKLLQLIRSSFDYADRNVSSRVQPFGRETASAQHMYDDKFVNIYRISAEILEKIYRSILFCSVAGDSSLNRTCEEARPHPQIFIATGDDFNTVAHPFRVEHSTVKTIICEVVKFPSTEEDF